METTHLQRQSFLSEKQSEKRIEIRESRIKVAQNIEMNAHKDLGFLLLLLVLFTWFMKLIGAFIGRESIKIQKAPGKFVSRNEEYQELENNLGPNAFFRMY